MNTARKRQTISGWLAEVLADPDKGKQCTHIVLVHAQGQHLIELHHKPVTPAMDLAATADLFKSKADAFAQDLSGAQTFQLLAFWGEAEPGARFPFIVAGEQFHNGLATEAPTAAGEKSQGMRHVEAGMQLAFRQSNLLFAAMESMIEKMSAREARLVAENHEAYEIVKEVMMEKINSQHAMEMKRLEFERSTGERKLLMSFAPALANTVLGTEVFPQGSEDTALIEALAEHLTPESASGMAGSLPPTLVGALMTRLQKYQGKKESEAKQLKEASKASTLQGEGIE